MGWRRGEVWFEAEVTWFGEKARAALAFPGPALAVAGHDAAAAPTPYGLADSRRRRAARRQQQRSRRAGAAAFVIGSTALIPLAVHRFGGSNSAAGALSEDPPSLTFRFGPEGIEFSDAPVPRWIEQPGAKPPDTRPAATRASANGMPAIEWRQADSRGLWYAGSLEDGTQLPLEGPSWVTWNPNTDSVPNAPYRLYGNERTVRTIVSVLTAYHAANPNAPKVVVGDISFRGGGPMDQHASHQNGLDVDVYYPRRDRALRDPVDASNVDRALTQDLLDRFVAAGAKMIFVGYHTGLHGPGGIVESYPNHENHMHVRFPRP